MRYRTLGRTGVQVSTLALGAMNVGSIDHVDRYQVRRWDPTAADVETLSALTDLRRAGKIRYFGFSTFPAYRIVQAQWTAQANHLGRYVTEQPLYSILQRGIGSHVLPGPRTVEHLHPRLAAADTVLTADVLDAVDEIVAPGTDPAPEERFDAPPALLDPALRRRR